jgi:KDO2-lipid IV(A) lauroyltransferase
MFLVRLLSLIFAGIPHTLVMAIAHLAYPFFYRGVKKGKWGLKARRIIPKVFKDKNGSWHERVVKANALHLMKFAGEMLKVHYISDRALRKRCYIGEGSKYLEELISSREGFMIITCHLGNWEYGAAYIAYKFGKIYAPIFVENSEANRALNWVREGHSVELLEASKEPRISAMTLKRMIKLLNQGEIIYLVADQAGFGGDYWGRFFGKELRMFGGPFVLGKKTKKPVLPMYTLRDEKNRIALHFEKPIHLNGENLKEDIAMVTDFFERNIRAHPEQYLWSQDRW